MSKDTFKYYQSNEKIKPSDKTIKLYLKSKKLNKLQLGILLKSLRKYYIKNEIGYSYVDNKESMEDEFLRNIKIIDDYKINKIDEDFNRNRAFENLNKFKTRMIVSIQLLFSCLVFFYSSDLILAIISIIPIELVILINNKKPTEKDFEKATEEMNKIRNK